ncbi:hypothetical protein A0J61_01844 [Choanephora cucurbitarum]|uniref:Uncharacterized protein n=1 Tax=Choanephora cucurbitarum TaxID=101091 RepID=A0A1C7NNS8_9FUNG|nr:hypothetical protein A0J61_01844 [Choanephora cucurbitarum]
MYNIVAHHQLFKDLTLSPRASSLKANINTTRCEMFGHLLPDPIFEEKPFEPTSRELKSLVANRGCFPCRRDGIASLYFLSGLSQITCKRALAAASVSCLHHIQLNLSNLPDDDSLLVVHQVTIDQLWSADKIVAGKKQESEALNL